MEVEQKRKRGRVPAGVGADGKPEMVSRYPKLSISMKPETKARLEAASTLTGLPAWRIIDQAVGTYLESVSPEDRKAIEGMARRMEERIPA
jgi:predicted DNA-binding protein